MDTLESIVKKNIANKLVIIMESVLKIHSNANVNLVFFLAIGNFDFDFILALEIVIKNVMKTDIATMINVYAMMVVIFIVKNKGFTGENCEIKVGILDCF